MSRCAFMVDDLINSGESCAREAHDDDRHVFPSLFEAVANMQRPLPEVQDPRAPVLEAFGITVESSAEIDALRALRALVLRTITSTRHAPTAGELGALMQAARAADGVVTAPPREHWTHSMGRVGAITRSEGVRLRKLEVRERSDRRGLDVVEIEAWCQHELIKGAPDRYKIDNDGWLVDTKGGRK